MSSFTAEDIRRYRDEHECSLQHAASVFEKRSRVEFLENLIRRLGKLDVAEIVLSEYLSTELAEEKHVLGELEKSCWGR